MEIGVFHVGLASAKRLYVLLLMTKQYDTNYTP